MIELGAIPGRGKAKIPHIWTGLLKAAVSLACLAAVIFYGAEAYVMLNRAEAPEAHATVSTPPDAPVAKVDTPMAFPQAVDQAGGYILQLGSYKSLETTLRAVDIYAQKQIDAYWAYLPGDDAIIWYRVFAGRFASHQQAQDYQKTHALSKAVVKFAPWTVAVGELGSKVQIGALRDLLKVHRLDGYEVPCKDGRWYLLSGAFLSRDGAEALSDQIRQYTGLTTRIANLGGRRPLEALHQPTNEDRHSS